MSTCIKGNIKECSEEIVSKINSKKKRMKKG
jgi:hypothetical protein